MVRPQAPTGTGDRMLQGRTSHRLLRTALLVAAVLATWLAAPAAAQAACTNTWQGGSGNWSTGLNWSSGTPPAATDDV